MPKTGTLSPVRELPQPWFELDLRKVQSCLFLSSPAKEFSKHVFMLVMCLKGFGVGVSLDFGCSLALLRMFPLFDTNLVGET